MSVLTRILSVPGSAIAQAVVNSHGRNALPVGFQTMLARHCHWHILQLFDSRDACFVAPGTGQSSLCILILRDRGPRLRSAVRVAVAIALAQSGAATAAVRADGRSAGDGGRSAGHQRVHGPERHDVARSGRRVFRLDRNPQHDGRGRRSDRLASDRQCGESDQVDLSHAVARRRWLSGGVCFEQGSRRGRRRVAHQLQLWA